MISRVLRKVETTACHRVLYFMITCRQVLAPLASPQFSAPFVTAMVAVKRKNLYTKMTIINTVECGEKKSDVASVYSIPRSTPSTILKNKVVI